MPSEDGYFSASKEQRAKFNDYVINNYELQQYLDENATKIRKNFEENGKYLSTLPESSLTEAQQDALNTWKIIKEKEQEKVLQEEKERKKELTLQRTLNGINTRAGFTNASIIMFCVLLTGIIIGVVLLSVS